LRSFEYRAIKSSASIRHKGEAMTIKTSSAAIFAAAFALAVESACTGTMDLGSNLQPDGAGGAGGAGGIGGTGGTGGAGGAGVCMPGSAAPCYTGPMGTENKGICAAGMKTCDAGGTGYGICQGEVIPQVENCATPEDEDCDGLSPACKGSLLWAKRFGDAFSQAGKRIAVDSKDNIIVTGTFAGTTDFGGGLEMCAGAGDVFIVELDPSGSYRWAMSAGDASNQTGESIAADGSGNVLLLGDLSGSANFGGGLLTSVDGIDVFLAKLAPDGTHLWSKRFGNEGDQYGASVAMDPQGNVVLTGRNEGSVSFGGDVLTNPTSGALGGGAVFVAKLDPSGEHLWSKQLGDGSDQYGDAVTTDGQGNIFVLAEGGGAMDFGGGPLIGAGGLDVFLAKLDPTGKHLWSKRFGDAMIQYGAGIAVDAQGNVFMLASSSGGIDFGGGLLASKGALDVFVAKLDPAGNHIWSKRFGDGGNQMGRGIAVSQGSEVLVTGYFEGQLSFGGGMLGSVGSNDIFLTKLGNDGNHIWSARFGAMGDDRAEGIAADGAGDTLLTGSFSGTTDFGSGPLMSAGATDIFVAKLSP
jgi:hypothetical protein